MTLHILKRWLGIKHNDGLIMQGEINRSIVTTRPMKKGEVLMKIPFDNIIDDDKLTDFDDIKNNVVATNSLIALYLVLHEHDPYWKPYYDILPKERATIFTMSEEANALIAGTYLAKEISAHKEYILGDLMGVLPHLGTTETERAENSLRWLHFRLMVGSRVFGYTKNNLKHTGMVPYVDMLNHAAEENCEWHCHASNEYFEVTATKDIPKGGEVCDSYGTKTNVQYFLYYGFTLEHAKPWTLELPHRISLSLNTSFNEFIDTFQMREQLSHQEAMDLLTQILETALSQIPDKDVLIAVNMDPDIIRLVSEERTILEHGLREIQARA